MLLKKLIRRVIDPEILIDPLALDVCVVAVKVDHRIPEVLHRDSIYAKCSFARRICRLQAAQMLLPFLRCGDIECLLPKEAIVRTYAVAFSGMLPDGVQVRIKGCVVKRKPPSESDGGRNNVPVFRAGIRIVIAYTFL